MPLLSRSNFNTISITDFVYNLSRRHYKQGNRRLHFARAVHIRHPFPAIGDAAYRQRAREGPSHGHRQHAQKIGKDRACGSGDILPDRRTNTQTDRHTHHNTSQPTSQPIVFLVSVH